ncbi:hypothetical protein E8E13_010898 [Curvularia kusanoi]|uniref:Uncharacterized protein n=1 Tax=Curvularia kusanoi TaxID=90978 RepID=A0A9P4TP85_CURKU|nr:hypothetical protein E8E13_010898 [Curvularia kusanoi]
MSSYGSVHSGQLHSSYQPQFQQQRARSYSNPPYPVTPGSVPYPQQQKSGYFPPAPPPAQQAPQISDPISIPASNRKRSSSDYVHGYGTSTSLPPPANSFSSSFPTHHLQTIPQEHIAGSYQYPSQQQQDVIPSPSGYEYQRRQSSSSQYAYDPRQSHESANSYQSAYSQPSLDFHTKQTHGEHGHHSHADHYYAGRENEGRGLSNANANTNAYGAGPSKGYGDWDKSEVSKYHKDQDLERRPTLGGSLMSLVKKIGGSERH